MKIVDKVLNILIFGLWVFVGVSPIIIFMDYMMNFRIFEHGVLTIIGFFVCMNFYAEIDRFIKKR